MTTQAGGTHRAAPSHIATLDGYRAVAAIGVLLYHTAGWTGFLVPGEPGAHVLDNAGNFGVAVFFVLSGFLLFRPFAMRSLAIAPNPSTPAFYSRRFLRIFPAYWLALIAWALTVSPEARAAGSTVGKLLLVEPYDLRVRAWEVGLGVSWTLTIELSFYLVLPLYAAALTWLLKWELDPRRRLRIQLLGLLVWYVGAIAYRWWLPTWEGRTFHTASWLFGYLDWFALGMLLGLAAAWVAVGGRLPAAVHGLADRTWACWTLAALCYASIVVLKGNELHFDRGEDTAQTMVRMFLQGLGAMFFLLPAMIGQGHGPGLRVLGSRPLTALGEISYGIYLWHAVAIYWFIDGATQSTARWRMLYLTSTVALATIPIAALSYYLFERPISTLFQPRSGRRAKPSNDTPDSHGDRSERDGRNDRLEVGGTT